MTTTESYSQTPTLVSLGSFVLDELRCPGRPAQYDVPGGSATFAVLGARLIAGKERAKDVGCIVMAGNDFPESAPGRFESWGVSLVIRSSPARQTTRGLLEYLDADFGSKKNRPQERRFSNNGLRVD